ncbi:unnamed protein product [Umbelopsis ramanniana]
MSIYSLGFSAKVAKVEPIVDVAVCAIILLSLLARHRSNAMWHYYVLELAVICGIIFDALEIQNTNILILYAPFDSPISTAKVVFSCLSLMLTQLTGLWALYFFSANYIGSSGFLASLPAALGTLWVAVVIVLTVVLRTIAYTSPLVDPFILEKVIFWAYPALSIWSIMGVFFVLVSVDRGYRQQYGIIKKTVFGDWTLLAIFITLFTLYTFWMVVMKYSSFPFNASEIVALVDLILSILLTRLSILLFVVFYNRLSAMLPIDERVKADELEEEETRGMYNFR